MKLGGKHILGHLRKLSHDLDFAEHLFAMVHVMEDVLNEFDSVEVARVLSPSLDDLSEATAANELDHVVVFLHVLPDGRQLDLFFLL